MLCMYITSLKLQIYKTASIKKINCSIDCVNKPFIHTKQLKKTLLVKNIQMEKRFYRWLNLKGTKAENTNFSQPKI